MARVAFAALLFAINAFVCQKLFFAEYLNRLGSVDGVFIAISRYAIENYRDLSWWPIWFGGMPGQNVYGPGLHFLVALAAAGLSISPALAFHAVAAAFYCLGPVTLFWMTCRFTGSGACGYSAGLMYSVVSPAAMLLPIVRADVGAFYLRRLHNIVIYGEAPHFAALALLPLALMALDAAIRSKKAAYYVLSTALLAGCVLTNVPGAVGLGMAVVALILAKPAAQWRRAVLMTVAIALGAYGLAMPWIPPSTLRLISSNAQWSTGSSFPFTRLHFLYFGLILGSATLLHFVFERLHTAAFLRFSLFLTLLSAAIVLPVVWMNVAVLPQPIRFAAEMEMGCCLAGGFVVARLLSRWPSRITAVVLLLAAAAGLIYNWRHANEMIQSVDIRRATEYKEATWFDQNMHGRRVFAPGSVSLWMNVFTDTPQLGGCCDQGVPNWEQRVALYTLYTGQNAGARDGEICLLWLQAYGAHAAGVSGPGGGEWYKPFWNPKKFDGLLPVLWRDGGDVIYSVPQRSDSLAHVIEPWQIVSRAPADGLDVAPLRTYVGALNDVRLPLATMAWTSRHSARIAAGFRPGDLLSVQVSYHPGWRALVNGSERRIESDALGMMVVHPECQAACTVELIYDGGAEMRIAKLVQLLCAIVALLLVAGPRQAGGLPH